jgi:hypothetical protein
VYQNKTQNKAQKMPFERAVSIIGFQSICSSTPFLENKKRAFQLFMVV